MELKKPDISYDTSLPTQHAYLGSDLEELSGRTVLDDDSTQRLPLLALPGIVLVPGQTLPLHLFNAAMVSMLKRIIEKDRTFGMINCRYHEPDFAPTFASIGTTAEVRSYREEVDDLSVFSSIRVKAEGRQRFKIIDSWRQIDGSYMANVQILPEVILSDPGLGVKLNCLDRFRVESNVKRSRKSQNHWHDRHNFANYTWWPPWVYKQYDSEILMQNLQNELSGWAISSKSVFLQSPSEFSFWVTANMPLDDNLRLKLLALNSPIQRLRCALSILKKCTILCCSHCDNQVANRNDIFSMSLEGPQGTYVNPAGHVHETITVYKAQGLTLDGSASTEHSWFPGYAWTIIQCQNCHSHMGWKFTALDNKLQPSKFWGLCRSSLELGLSKACTYWTPIS